MQQTLVLGIGNTLLGDEGAGVHALNALRRRPETRFLELVDAGTLSFTLMPIIEAYSQLIVIDATNVGAPPGTVRVFEDAQMDRFLTRATRSVHEVSVCDVLQVTRLAGLFPARRALIGIQPEVVSWQDGPSPAIAASFDEVADHVFALLQRWQQTPFVSAA